MYNLPNRQEIDGECFYFGLPRLKLSCESAIAALGNDGWDWQNFHKFAKKAQKSVMIILLLGPESFF